MKKMKEKEKMCTIQMGKRSVSMTLLGFNDLSDNGRNIWVTWVIEPAREGEKFRHSLTGFAKTMKKAKEEIKKSFADCSFIILAKIDKSSPDYIEGKFFPTKLKIEKIGNIMTEL